MLQVFVWDEKMVMESKYDFVIFFDGHCNLCNAFVDFAIRWDQKQLLYYAPLQGEAAKKLLDEEDDSSVASVVYFEKGKVSYESSAVIRALAKINVVFIPLKLFLLVPESIRNFAYQYVAKNRYKWFGKRETCRLPTKEESKHLLS